MDIKSVGLLRSGPALEDLRAKTAERLKDQSSFQRATPPEADSGIDNEEVNQGLLRMADYLKKFQSRGSKKKKHKSAKPPRKRAVEAYAYVSQSETTESFKGHHFSKFV